MQIQGPFQIQVITNEDSQSRELHLSFSNEFQRNPLEQRLSDFRRYIGDLQKSIGQTDDPASQQGMLTILQISEQILPHLEADEIPLEEPIVVEIGPSSPFDQLLDSARLK